MLAKSVRLTGCSRTMVKPSETLICVVLSKQSGAGGDVLRGLGWALGRLRHGVRFLAEKLPIKLFSFSAPTAERVSRAVCVKCSARKSSMKSSASPHAAPPPLGWFNSETISLSPGACPIHGQFWGRYGTIIECAKSLKWSDFSPCRLLANCWASFNFLMFAPRFFEA